MSEFECRNESVKQTKGLPLFRLSPDDRTIVQGQMIILSSGDNLNTGNPFVHLMDPFLYSNSANNYWWQTDMLSIFRLCSPDKI